MNCELNCMNCELNCPRAYTSPQGNRKCILPQDDKPSIMLKIEANRPQKHWLCEHSPKSMKCQQLTVRPDIKQYVINRKKDKNG